MIKSKLKSGFTLIELMVFFIFISILLAASTPIITKRVKNLPLKVYHGKYMCYRNADGELMEEYYNASIRVTGPTAVADDACHFNPPKKATVYKIEMIGGGAGGYKYFGEPVRTVELEEREGEYRIGDGMSYTDSKYHEVPDGAQLRRIFRNAKFRYVSDNVGQGGRGSDVLFGYSKFSGIGDEIRFNEDYEYLATCGEQYLELSSTQQQACCNYSERYREANGLVTEWNDRLSGTYEDNLFILIAASGNVGAFDEKLDPFATVHTTSGLKEKTAYGADGGSGGYLIYDGLIDFKDYSKDPAVPISTDDVDSYLKNLKKRMTTGSLSEPAVEAACTGSWSDSRPNEGVNAEPEKLQALSNTNLSVSGTKGGDVERYGALKLWNRWCVSNETRATGGVSAYAVLKGEHVPQHIRYDSYYSPGSDLQKGDDAGGVVGDKSTGLGPDHRFSFSSSYQRSAWPSLIIKTSLHKITHNVGLNGTSGQVKTVFESNLRDDCEFTIGKAGLVIDDTYTDAAIANEESKLATTLSCNDRTINHRVEGGRYQKSTYPDEKSEFEYMHKNEFTFTTNPPTDGSASQYNPTNIFTRYNIGEHHFGQGGAGSGIVDNCMHPQGYYKHILQTMDGVRDDAHSEEYKLDPFTCEMDNTEHIEKINPTKGVGGAIIISW